MLCLQKKCCNACILLKCTASTGVGIAGVGIAGVGIMGIGIAGVGITGVGKAGASRYQCEALGNLQGWNVRGAMDNWSSRHRYRM